MQSPIPHSRARSSSASSLIRPHSWSGTEDHHSDADSLGSQTDRDESTDDEEDDIAANMTVSDDEVHNQSKLNDRMSLDREDFEEENDLSSQRSISLSPSARHTLSSRYLKSAAKEPVHINIDQISTNLHARFERRVSLSETPVPVIHRIQDIIYEEKHVDGEPTPPPTPTNPISPQKESPSRPSSRSESSSTENMAIYTIPMTSSSSSSQWPPFSTSPSRSPSPHSSPRSPSLFASRLKRKASEERFEPFKRHDHLLTLTPPPNTSTSGFAGVRSPIVSSALSRDTDHPNDIERLEFSLDQNQMS